MVMNKDNFSASCLAFARTKLIRILTHDRKFGHLKVRVKEETKVRV